MGLLDARKGLHDRLPDGGLRPGSFVLGCIGRRALRPLQRRGRRSLGRRPERPPRAVLIRAEGRVVSAGVDVHLFDDMQPEDSEEFWRHALEIIERLETLPCPVVFAAHALTLTAAFELALGCDIILAARSAKFGLVENVVALTPSMGGPARIAERAGSGRARELVMTGELFGAEQLERWNIVNRVFDDEELPDRALEMARALAKGPTRAHAATKEIVRGYVTDGLARADEILPSVAGALYASEDHRDAVAGFLEHGPRHETPMHGR
ncbi:MAG: enoyl-CoA hydratase/isomerase family protein [Myxococcaceae bacterium]|nr:MAG: enoyl-CoA hydratase/isomerase family protein [Myxococcaceae bacterium]